MNLYLKLCLGICFPVLLQAQISFNNNGTNIKIKSGTDLHLNNGSISNFNNGTIENSGNIYVELNYTQTTNASYNGTASSWLWFNGNSNQVISGDATLNIAKIKVDNGNRLILGNHVQVDNLLDLNNNGSVELGNSNLLIAPSANISNYNESNYILCTANGYLQQQVGAAAVVFPIGNIRYNPVILSNAGTQDNFRANLQDYVLDAYPFGTIETSNVVGKAWFIEEEIVGGSDISMTLQWATADELQNFNRSASGISFWNGNTWNRSPSWTNASNVGGTNWTQTRTGISNFNRPFAVEDDAQFLPIELISFDVKRINPDKVQLDWATISELNNEGFEIERMLDNEDAFRNIDFVQGQGNSSLSSYYQIIDANSYPNISYYRLKQLDFDGSFAYSEVRAVAGTAKINPLGASIFPNPVGDVLNVRFSDLAKGIQKAEIKIMAINGQLLQELSVPILSHQLLQIDYVRDLVPATYLLSIQLDNGQQLVQKFVKK